ncbi:unnamed protein product [Symbiodinium natans]|uniref:Sfi1 spindle body domain-containing protein n=1 Tax=Symbiodinium natans TaxID=878477 RepID=A0A812T6R6_9DINO|nr:unnamed protein product [Symbiodinium natans]
MSQAMRHDLQHHSVQEELSQVLGTLMSQQEDLQRTRKRLAGATRTVALSLCHGQTDTVRLALSGWRRRAQRTGEAGTRASARTKEFSDSLLHLVLARWHQVAKKQKHRHQVCAKALHVILKDQAAALRILVGGWHLLAKAGKADAQALQQRRTGRDTRCAALQRFVWEFDSALLLSALAAWTRSTKAVGLRKRFVKGSANFCETVDGLCQAARLQALFTAWVDVLVISQTAAMRLGIRRPQEALCGLWGAQGVTKRRQAVDEQQLQQQLHEAARAQARLAPIRLQHLTAQAVFSQWSGFITQLHQARSLAALVEQRMAQGILRGTFGGWRDVHSRNPSAVIRAKQHNWTTRRGRCLGRVLTSALDRDGQALDRLTWTTAFSLWAAESRRARGERVGSAEKLSDNLAVTVMLWRQDQFYGLVSRTMVAWQVAVIQDARERHQQSSEARRVALLQAAQVLTRDTPNMLAATLALRALLAWRRLAQVSDVRVNRRKAHIAAVLTTSGKKSDEGFLRICVHWWQMEAKTASHTSAQNLRKSNFYQLAEYVLHRDELFCVLEVWFVRWRWSYFGQRCISLEGEVRMLANLLNESTLTCRELRTQLLTLRGSSWRMGRTALWAMFIAWHRMISATPRIEGIPATASMPAVAAGLRVAARRLSTTVPAITR